MDMHFLVRTCLVAATFISVSVSANGLTLTGTRLIYDATKKEASITLTSSGKVVPYLVQSWVSDVDGKTEDIPFIITPPLSKLAPDSSIEVRVVNVAQGPVALPADRESLYVLNIRAIPATEKAYNQRRMTIAIQNSIKLIYRPAGLTSRESTQAIDRLTASAVAEGIKFTNPTAYVVTLANMSINGSKVERPGVVMPFSTTIVHFGASLAKEKEVSFVAVNDFGGTTESRSIRL
ncbi:MAG: fimbrial biogenesis chaperone [Aeromonas popoffii]|uniref:fimbrial biogenesis chaperone n=1 Tax=Aeromonas popoffii TaxID=70856 RepID=UPI003F313762